MFSLRKNSISSFSVGKQNSPPHPSRAPSMPMSFEPAIDGPPSPEGIRAYTEQMKRGTLLIGHTRSYTVSSTSSFRSGSSETISGDSMSLSQQPSRVSDPSIMSYKSDRPESVQIFGKTIFSRRNVRKSKLDTGSSRSSSSLSTHPSMNGDYPAPDRRIGGKGSRRGTVSDTRSLDSTSKKPNISGPFNFQHLTHTRQEQLPNLDRASRMELLTEFSAIRASQTPAHGQLKGIRAVDLHFENFSSEDLNAKSETTSDSDLRPQTSPQRSAKASKKATSPVEPRQKLTHTRSNESLRTTPSPPRSQLICPPPPPPRTSSRSASTLWDAFDTVAPTPLERPQTVSSFRKPTAFHLPIYSPPKPITRSEEPQDIIISAAGTSSRIPNAESWPLPPGALEKNFLLADVPEEEENYAASRRSRISSTSVDLRSSRSVPNFAIQNCGIEHAMPKFVRPQTPSNRHSAIGLAVSPVESAIQLTNESWEDDIDYCYEHAAEANCNYEWDRCSTEEELQESTNSSDVTILDQKSVSEPVSPKPNFEPPASDVDVRRFRPSLLVPSTMDLPELSPLSSSSVDSPELRTPGLLRPGLFRTNSRASSFKESHGFTLSPTLLIPADFSAQIDQETLYDELFSHNQDTDAPLKHYDPFPISPVEGPSSSSSHRSSALSRASNGATISKSGSHESVVLLSSAASVALQHRSVSSSSSLPDLIYSYSMRPKSDAQELDHSQSSQPYDSTPAPDIPLAEPLRRKISSGLRIGSVTEQLEGMLSPVHETFSNASGAPPPIVPWPSSTILPTVVPAHGRKISAPVASPRVGAMENLKGRKRAMSAKSRASYGLFPQI